MPRCPVYGIGVFYKSRRSYKGRLLLNALKVLEKQALNDMLLKRLNNFEWMLGATLNLCAQNLWIYVDSNLSVCPGVNARLKDYVGMLCIPAADPEHSVICLQASASVLDLGTNISTAWLWVAGEHNVGRL